MFFLKSIILCLDYLIRDTLYEIYFPHRQPTAIITDVGSLCRVLWVLPFRDIVLE